MPSKTTVMIYQKPVSHGTYQGYALYVLTQRKCIFIIFYQYNTLTGSFKSQGSVFCTIRNFFSINRVSKRIVKKTGSEFSAGEPF